MPPVVSTIAVTVHGNAHTVQSLSIKPLIKIYSDGLWPRAQRWEGDAADFSATAGRGDLNLDQSQRPACTAGVEKTKAIATFEEIGLPSRVAA